MAYFPFFYTILRIPKGIWAWFAWKAGIDSKHPKVYEDATAGEYLDERLREIGLKK